MKLRVHQHILGLNMSNLHLTFVDLQQLAKPLDCRSREELERYYRDLAHHSPLGRMLSTVAAENSALAAQSFAEVTTQVFLSRMTTRAQQTADMLVFARDVADIWADLNPTAQLEQVEAHLESEFPHVAFEKIEAISRRACGT